MWYFAQKGVKTGPLTEEALRRRITNNEVKAYDLVWHKNMPDWETAQKQFPELFTVSAKKIGVAWPLVAFITATLCLGIMLMLWFSDPTPDHLGPLALCWVAFISTGLFVASRLFKKGHALRKGPDAARGGALYLGGALIVLTFLLPTLLSLGQLKGVLRAQLVRLATSNYTMQLNPSDRSQLVIAGYIGRGFPEKLQEYVDNYDIKEISITSDGGLVLESFAAGKIVNKRPDISVIAKRKCNSGCIIFLLGAEKRYAEHDLEFGFHGIQVAMGTDEEKNSTGIQKLKTLADQLSKIRNVPEDVIAVGLGSDKYDYTYVPAQRLFESGTLTGLYRNGHLVTKAKFVPEPAQEVQQTQQIQKAQQTQPRLALKTEPLKPKATGFLTEPPAGMAIQEVWAINRLIAAFEQKLPGFDQHIRTLEAAKNSADDLTMEMRKLMNLNRREFAKEASPAAAYAHFKALEEQTKEYAKYKLWRRCSFYPDDVSTFARKNLNNMRIPKVYNTYAQMITSGNPAYRRLLEDTKVKTTLAQFAEIGALIYNKSLSKITGTQEEKEDYAGCEAELMFIKLVEQTPANLRGTYAKGYFLLRSQ